MEIHVVVLRRKPLAAEANWLDSRGFVKLPLRLLTGTSRIRIDHCGPSGGSARQGSQRSHDEKGCADACLSRSLSDLG